MGPSVGAGWCLGFAIRMIRIPESLHGAVGRSPERNLGHQVWIDPAQGLVVGR